MKPAQEQEGVRLVALFEASKGALVLLAGFGLLAYIHKDLHEGAARLVRLFHLNPASRFPRIFIDLAGHITDSQLWILATFALLYAALRFVEAYGLWRQRSWAEWFALISGGVYVPLEVLDIARGVTWPRLTLLLVNSGIVAYLSLILYSKRHNKTQADENREG
jgi:uncharacterized membrane protein (DUF2068 family)